MKKLILFVLSAVFLVACTGMEKKDNTDMKSAVAGKTFILEGSIEGSTIDVTFDDDKISGSAGVNRYFAPYMIKGNKIDVSIVGSTRRMGPENLMKQEMEFTKDISEASEIRLAGEKLVITTADGKDMTFVEKAETLADKLEEKTFVLEGPLPEYEVTINFSEGRLAGKGGVNNYSASYELEGDRLTVSPQIITTMMAGPEEAMDKEAQYLSDLAKAEKAEITDGRLVITLTDGTQLIFK